MKYLLATPPKMVLDPSGDRDRWLETTNLNRGVNTSFRLTQNIVRGMR